MIDVTGPLKTDEPSMDAAGALAAGAEVEPPIPWARFVKAVGVNRSTAWRWRVEGMIRVANLCGRLYVFQSEVARFNAQLAAGDFAKPFKGAARRNHRGLASPPLRDWPAED